MATIVSQGASATVSLPAGSNIAVTGTGFAVMGPGRLQGTQYGLQGSTRVGPFDTAQTVYLTSTTTALSYTIAPGYVGAGPVQTARNADGTPSGLIDPATGQLAGVNGNSPIGSRIAPVSSGSIVSSLPKFQAALKLTAQRKKPTIVLFNGDSTEAGFGNGTGTNGFSGAGKMTHARQVARMLGWQDSGVVGAGCGTDVALNLYDERTTISGAGVAVSPSVDALCGGWIVFANGATGSYTITPRGSKGFDRVVIVYGRYATGGASSMGVSVGGASIGTFDARGGTGLGDTQVVTLPCTYASPSTPIVIQGSTGTTDGQCVISAVYWYDSSDPGVIVLNGGTSGAKASHMMSTSNPWTARYVSAALAPDLRIVNLWINDTYYGTTPAQYTSDLVAFRDAVSPVSDLVYMGYQPINHASMTNGQGDAIFAAMQAVAGSAPVIDLRNVFGPTFAYLNALGVSYDNGLHITSLGQYYKACNTASAIAP